MTFAVTVRLTNLPPIEAAAACDYIRPLLRERYPDASDIWWDAKESAAYCVARVDADSGAVAAAALRQFMMEMAVAAVVEYPEDGVLVDVVDAQAGDRRRS